MAKGNPYYPKITRNINELYFLIKRHRSGGMDFLKKEKKQGPNIYCLQETKSEEMKKDITCKL